MGQQGTGTPCALGERRIGRNNLDVSSDYILSLYPFSQFNGISSCIPNISNMYYIIDGIIMINNLEY